MPFVQRVVEPRLLSRTRLFGEDGRPLVAEDELLAITNSTLSNAVRQLHSLVLIANDIFNELESQFQDIKDRSVRLKKRLDKVEKRVEEFDPKTVSVPESDICTFALLKEHYARKQELDDNLFSVQTRPAALQALYQAASKTPVHVMRQLDTLRRDGQRSSRFFVCTPVLGAKRRKIRNTVDIEIETCMPAAVEELRRWTSEEALGDITVSPDCVNRIGANTTCEGEVTDGTIASDDEGIDHKLPSPEEQIQVVALKFPAEVVAVDISGRSFDRMSIQRRSLLHADSSKQEDSTLRRRTRTRKPRNRRRNTLAGTDQKEIQDALQGEEAPVVFEASTSSVPRSKSSDLLRASSSKKDSSPKGHFNSLKQWGKTRYDKLMNRSNEQKKDDIDDFNLYETVTIRRRRDYDKERKTHERNSSISSSEKSSINIPVSSTLQSMMNIAVKLRDSSVQRRLRRSGGSKEEPHSSSGNWSASSESGRASIGSEITTTTQPKSTTSAATSSNSLNQPGSVNSRRRFNMTSASSSVTSEGTLTPDIIHDLHEDGETSSIYSCDTEGYYTSFHMDSGLKTLKEEDLPSTPLHSTTAFSNSSNNTVLTAENEYELFGKGSTSTTTSSAGTVCTTLRASESTRSLVIGPAVPERKSSLSNKSKSPESSLERDFSDKTGTIKRSPSCKPTIIALIHKTQDGDVSPDSGHNTSSSPIESINSPSGLRSGSEYEFSESSDMEGPERIERIRVKTTINSSRIPSMCVITPPHSDDESVKSHQSDRKLIERNNINVSSLGSNNQNREKLDLTFKPYNNEELKSTDSDKENCNVRIITTVNNNKVSLINVNPQSGYATVQNLDQTDGNHPQPQGSVRSASPSGGTVIIKESPKDKSPQMQPLIKATLMPLNLVFGRLKNNIVNYASRKDKSPNRNTEIDAGEYVTIADLKNNNEKKTIQEEVQKNLKAVLQGKQETEYVSLNELPCNSPQTDSLERRRKGARVTLDAEGKVVYSSDSLRRRKAPTTFEPGPFVKAASPCSSPLMNRGNTTVRPVQSSQNQRLANIPSVEFNRPLSPQSKVVIRAGGGGGEVVRVPPSTIVAPRALSPKPVATRGAYVHVQEPTQEKEGVPLGNQYYAHAGQAVTNPKMYHYQELESKRYQQRYYLEKGIQPFQTLPSRKTYLQQNSPERSVTPDITRGLERRHNLLERRAQSDYFQSNNQIGIPIQEHLPYSPIKSNEDLKISPIDPRNSGGFKSSTPSNKRTDLKTAVNLESQMMNAKKSTMSNEELYAIIHKSKKRMNIEQDDSNRSSPVNSDFSPKNSSKGPETGYLGGDRSRSRLSWSPSKGEYVDFNSDIDKFSPPNDSRSRQSWACTDRKPPQKQTSTLDFKKLLLKKSNILSGGQKKISAVEQLKLSKQQIQAQTPKNDRVDDMSILELSGSPRSLVNRRNISPNSSPKHSADKRPVPKILSPRSQWRFANPRTDVLSSTILEDCREDESPNSSLEKKEVKTESDSTKVYSSVTQRLQAQRAQFFNEGLRNSEEKTNCKSKPALETAF